ncbi:MAG: TetR/AcrR family transcriptional regulator [Prevotellaceae bacterium]|jgi:AcrR family transcriptional regulator|nr:TetR/AcrR family transcriptional regulator [Prevotellaceae bacterium]
MKNNYTEVQSKIAKTARELFVKKGFKATTVRDIATESGVNVAMVNYYFNSKSELFDSIFEEAFNMMSEKIFYLMDSELPFFELIRQWIYSYYDMLMEYPDLPLFVMNELSTNPNTLDKCFHSNPYLLYLKISKRIKKEVTRGTIRPVNVPDLLLNIISLSIFPFAARPMAGKLLNLSDEQYMEMIDHHREYVVNFVIKAIKA